MSLQQPVNVAVVGAGYWGKNLVRNFHGLGALRYVCDSDQALVEDFKGKYPGLAGFDCLEALLPREDVDAVALATPAETHFPMIKASLLAGKHVYVEKPLALHESEARELTELAEKQGRTLMVGHLLQYHPAFVKLKEIALSGQMGRIHYIYSHRLNLGKIRREENILWSFAPHDVSMILSLAGDMPESVQAGGGNYLHPKVADVTTTHLTFASGLRAHIFVSWLHPFKEQKLVVVGEKLMAVFDDTLPWEDKLLLYPHEIRWEYGMPVPAKAKAMRVEVEREEPLKLECAHFLECAATGEKPLTDGEEGLRVLTVLNASQRSMDSGGKVETLQTPSQVDEKTGPDFFVHESSYVDDKVQIGAGTKVWHFCHIMPGSVLGKNVNVGQNVVIGPNALVGDNCKIQNNVSVYKGVTLEQGVFCGPSMAFTNVFNPRAEIKRMDEMRETLVKRGATMGANCTIVCGNVVGRYSFVGAGAVVISDVPDHAMVVGNPARLIGWVCECGNKLDDELVCLACGKRYRQAENGLGEILA